MGRPPCCDKVGIKKGPWTPEEDIILVSYIQEHGPGNWRSVPTNTGLSRCSKSCRLRWTNYLRPGIKRGNFTPHEEGMIIHLQALLGNKWAAIASYLPQRTDNDIKNYWNTHLKKKLKKFQAALEPHHHHQHQAASHDHQYLSKSFSDRSLDISNNHASSLRLNNSTTTTTTTTATTNSHSNSQSSTYASSTENISRLLEGWMRTSPKPLLIKGSNNDEQLDHQDLQLSNDNNDDGDDDEDDVDDYYNFGNGKLVKSASVPAGLNLDDIRRKDDDHAGGGDMVSHEEFESILSFENLNNAAAWDKSTCDSMPPDNKCSVAAAAVSVSASDKNNNNINRQKSDNSSSSSCVPPPPLSFLEKWLLDENVGHVEEMMELSPMF